MSIALRLCSLCTVVLVVACGCSRRVSTVDPGDPPPHGGTLLVLPDRSGMVEIVKKTGTAPIAAEVAFYFFSEGYAPCDPAPQSGYLLMDDQRKVQLVADGDALVTPTGPLLFEDRDVDGVLCVELDGETRHIPLGVR